MLCGVQLGVREQPAAVWTDKTEIVGDDVAVRSGTVQAGQ